jgi:hypothetical protein
MLAAHASEHVGLPLLLQPDPKVQWVDNYYGDIPFFWVGGELDGAYNVDLLRTQDGIYRWYADTIAEGSLDGFRFSAVASDNFGLRPEPRYWGKPVGTEELGDGGFYEHPNAVSNCQGSIGTGGHTCIERSPAWIIADITIPLGAEFLEFDFLFGNVGDGDWLSVFFNDEELMAFLGLHFWGAGHMHALIPIGHLAGLSGELGFVLYSVGEANATLEVANVMFTRSVPEPTTLALFGLGLAGIGALRRKKLAA